MKKKWYAAVSAALMAGLGGSVMATPLTPGDLVVYRVGTGTGTLVNTGNAVFIDEYTPAGVLVQSIAAPTADSGSTHALIASGTATSEGLLTISPDGQFVAFTGYDTTTTANTSSIANTTSAAVPRTIGILNVSTGLIDTTTALSNYASGNNPRSAVTTDGTTIYASGGAGGVIQTTLGSTGSSDTQFSSTAAGNTVNLRQINIFSGNLYASTSSGSNFRIGQLAAGTPPTSFANLPGLSASTGSPYSFFFADLSPTVPGLDTLYVADDGNATNGTIQKYSLVSGSWTANGTIAASNLSNGVRGLTGSVSGGVVSLFSDTGTGTSTGGGAIWSLTDSSGYDNTITGTLNTLATLSSTSDEAFRGIALVPTAVPEPAGLATLGIAGMGLLRRRRRQM